MAEKRVGVVEIQNHIPKRYKVVFKSHNGKDVAESIKFYNSRARAINAAKSVIHLLKEPRLVFNTQGIVEEGDKNRLK